MGAKSYRMQQSKRTVAALKAEPGTSPDQKRGTRKGDVQEPEKGTFKISGRTLIRLSKSRENIFHGHGVRRLS